MTIALIALLVAFTISMLIAPLVIRLMRRLKAGQPILSYVEKHSGKSGVPTMGGFIFVLPVFIVMLIFGGIGITMGKYASYVMLGYCIIGFLDDYIKVKYKENKGLKAYQKIIGQIAIGTIIAIYAYQNMHINTSIILPFINYSIEFKQYYVPFVIFIFIASTNAVNLTDGLDGLCSSISIIYFAAFTIIILSGLSMAEYYGDILLARQYNSLAVFSSATCGSLLAFYWLNSNPAKIFMGDTGSLAIGSAVACVGVFSNNPLLIIIIGIMYIVSSISVIIQVIYFKLSKGKRVFLMAPYHHHLEYKGYKEWKIVAYYSVITLLAAVVALIDVL